MKIKKYASNHELFTKLDKNDGIKPILTSIRVKFIKLGVNYRLMMKQSPKWTLCRVLRLKVSEQIFKQEIQEF